MRNAKHTNKHGILTILKVSRDALLDYRYPVPFAGLSFHFNPTKFGSAITAVMPVEIKPTLNAVVRSLLGGKVANESTMAAISNFGFNQMISFTP